MGAAVEAVALEKDRSFWLRRSHDKSDNPRQTSRISSLLRASILPTQYYENALDLGCGRGRFVPILSSFCGHVWAVDIVPELLHDIEFRAQSATGFCIGEDYKLPDGPHDLLWSAFMFQHILSQTVFLAVCEEVRRVMKPGARVFLLENAKDRAAHVRPWSQMDYAVALKLDDYRVKLVTVNERPNDHWWIEGRMK
jgi:ubiquinone/menaquinone biosynthesis C-methylase UbiE